MKTGIILKQTGIMFLLALLIGFYSCTRTSDEEKVTEQNKENDQNAEFAVIDEKDFSETDEDLATVDYNEFYESLSPYGEWIEVRPEDVGIQSGTTQNYGTGSGNFSLAEIFGVKDAFADDELNLDYIFVWKPSPEFGVSFKAGEEPEYVPYTNGQWIYTDAGWYFKGKTPAEETVSHYGRWYKTPASHWVWIPGRVWSPAWVDWKMDDTYISWAPLPASVYLNNGIMSTPVIEDDYYIVVDKKYFPEPEIYRYAMVYDDYEDIVRISEIPGIEGVIAVNNTILNRGPKVGLFEILFNKKIEVVKIQPVPGINDIKYSESVYNIYKPVFKKLKNKNTKRSKPKSYMKYAEWKSEINAEKENEKEKSGKNESDKVKMKTDNGQKNGNSNEKGNKKNNLNKDTGKEGKNNGGKDKNNVGKSNDKKGKNDNNGKKK